MKAQARGTKIKLIIPRASGTPKIKKGGATTTGRYSPDCRSTTVVPVMSQCTYYALACTGKLDLASYKELQCIVVIS